MVDSGGISVLMILFCILVEIMLDEVLVKVFWIIVIIRMFGFRNVR